MQQEKTNQNNKNLSYWERFRGVPDTARKPITDGKLKGKTDINPVWRLKMLTEAFGPCGQGWHIETVERWTDNFNGELIANVRIKLLIHPTDSATPWQPIEGIGASKLFGFGKGQNCDDEAWKMATTDAISVACKNLGIAADIYYAKDATSGERQTKYDSRPESETGRAPQLTYQPAPPVVQQPAWTPMQPPMGYPYPGYTTMPHTPAWPAPGPVPPPAPQQNKN